MARPIDLDKREIARVVSHDLMPQIVRRAERHPRQDEPIGETRGWASAQITVAAADGRDTITVAIEVESERSRVRGVAVLGGKSNPNTGVTLYLNGALTPADLHSPERARRDGARASALALARKSMNDRGYWARLGQEQIYREHPDDHPLGLREGGVNRVVMQRLAVLREKLTKDAQRQAFDAAVGELMMFCRQANGVVEELRTMARTFKNLEDEVVRGDLRDLRETVRLTRRFDDETYKRSSALSADLHEFAERGEYSPRDKTLHGRFNWEQNAEEGRLIDRLLEERKVAAKQQAIKQQEAVLMLKHTGPLYKTGPAGVDWVKPRNERKDIAAAERRLEELGFEVQVEGVVRAYVRSWGDFVVYADPRRGDTLHFHVFRGSQRLESFWVKDRTRDPGAKIEESLAEVSARRTTR